MNYSIIEGYLEPAMPILLEDEVLTDAVALELRWILPDASVQTVNLTPVDLAIGSLQRTWIDGDTDEVGIHRGRVIVTWPVVWVADAWVAVTDYVLGDLVTNGGLVYECITAGESAASGGPTGTTVDVTDGTVHWAHLGNATGDTREQVYPFDGSWIIWHVYPTSFE